MKPPEALPIVTMSLHPNPTRVSMSRHGQGVRPRINQSEDAVFGIAKSAGRFRAPVVISRWGLLSAFSCLDRGQNCIRRARSGDQSSHTPNRAITKSRVDPCIRQGSSRIAESCLLRTWSVCMRRGSPSRWRLRDAQDGHPLATVLLTALHLFQKLALRANRAHHHQSWFRR